MTRHLDTSSTPSLLAELAPAELDHLAGIADEEQRMIAFRGLLEQRGKGDDVAVLSVAENALLYDDLRTQVFDDLPHPLPQERTRYASPTEKTNFLEALCPLLSTAFGAEVLPEHVSPTSGVSGALESIAMALQSPGPIAAGHGQVPAPRTANDVPVPKGSNVLIPAPCWQGFDWCFEEFPALRCVYVPTFTDPGFELTVSGLQAAYEKCETPPRMLVLTNPHNPLGVNYPRDLLTSIYRWALEKTPRMHIISDEIYRHSQLIGTGDQFVSALEIVKDMDESLDAQDRVHVVWGFSKDFGLSGFRMGVVISQADYIHRYMSGSPAERRRLAWFSQFSSLKHRYLNPIVTQEEVSIAPPPFSVVMDRYPEKLTASYERVASILNAYDIKFFRPSDSNSAVFFWLDLREFLPREVAAEPADVLFGPAGTADPEQVLATRIRDNAKVTLLTGTTMHMSTKGFYRLCFTAYDAETVARAVERMCRYLTTGAREHA